LIDAVADRVLKEIRRLTSERQTGRTFSLVSGRRPAQ
jgi:hypothetical protein